jgi:ribosomal protein S20
MSLRELIGRFGTDIAFKDWLAATKQIEDINEKRLKNATTRGELVSRELVKNHIVEPIDAALQKLLTDGAKTMAKRVDAMINAGRSVDECETYIRETISSFIRPMKTKVSRTLKNVGN